MYINTNRHSFTNDSYIIQKIVSYLTIRKDLKKDKKKSNERFSYSVSLMIIENGFYFFNKIFF